MGLGATTVQNEPIGGSGKWALITVCPDLIGMTHDPKVDRQRSMEAYKWLVEAMLVPDWGYMKKEWDVVPGVDDIKVEVHCYGVQPHYPEVLAEIAAKVRDIAWEAAGNPQRWIRHRKPPVAPPNARRIVAATMWVQTEDDDGTVMIQPVTDDDELRGMLGSGFVTRYPA